MIIKNLSRKSGSGQLVRYIFKYIFRGDEVLEKEPVSFEDTLLSLGIQFTAKDIRYLEAEVAEAKLMADFKEKSPDNDYQYYIQNYLLKDRPGIVAEQPKEYQSDQPFVIKHNIRSNSISGYIKEFERNESHRLYRRSDQVSIHHTILSWSNLDKGNVSDAMLKDMAQEYIRLRGENNLYVGTVHKDREHIHLHIAMSGTQLNGRSSRVSKQEFQGIKIQLQEYQKLKYPELANSLPEHGKSNRQKLTRDDLKTVKRNERHTIKNDLLWCLETISPTSTEHLLSELQSKGYSPYYRAGRLTGVQHEQGIKFRFSRLPVDMDKLKELDTQRVKENEELSTIRDIRMSKQKGMTKSRIQPRQQVKPDREDEDRELLELQDLRSMKENDREHAPDSNKDREINNHADDSPERAIDDPQDSPDDENDEVRETSGNDTGEDDIDNDIDI